MFERPIESVRNAYLDSSSAVTETISEIILELVCQNQLFIRKNRRQELDSAKNENQQLLNLYSQVLLLQSRIR